jgi:valyl-tRNA synthetase
LAQVTQAADQYLAQYEHSLALSEIEKFFWQFCDDYLELVKERSRAGCKSAQATLFIALDTLLKLFAPFLPFTTSEIYSWYNSENQAESDIHLQNYPVLPPPATAAITAGTGSSGDTVTQLNTNQPLATATNNAANTSVGTSSTTTTTDTSTGIDTGTGAGTGTGTGISTTPTTTDSSISTTTTDTTTATVAADSKLLSDTSQILTSLRGIRSQEKVGFKVPLVSVEISLSPALQSSFQLVEADLLAALNAQKITVTAANESANLATEESELTASSYQSTADQSDTEIKVLRYQLG